MQEKYIKVNRPSGTEEYKVLHAFEKDGNKYIVIDSKLKDSNQLTITFISKINGSNLEYIEGKEWDDFVKQELIPVVKGISDSICFKPQEEYQAGEQFGHPLALKDAHVSALISNYQLPVENKFEEVQSIVEPKENLQVGNQTNEISVIEESQVVLQPEVPMEENSNNESQEMLLSDSVMAISPEQEMNSISPVIEQSVEEPVVNDNSLNQAIENANMGSEVFTFVQEPIISEQPLVTDDVQPEVQIVNTPISDSIETDEFDLLQNNIVLIFDKLKVKEKQLNDKEIELKEKEEQLNKKESELKVKEEQLEIDKKQVEEDKKNNDTYSQVLVQTQERWKQNGVQVPEASDYSQTQTSDFTEANQVVIQDSPEGGLSRTLSQVA